MLQDAKIQALYFSFLTVEIFGELWYIIKKAKEKCFMADTFKLPASSLDEILKLVQAYANEKEGTLLSLDDISHSTGVPRTAVSGNNGFLVQIGLITEGNKKAATEIGRSLGRAYISKIDYEIERIWKEIIAENDFLNRMISAVRIRGGMDRTSFLNHIIYSSGQKDTKQCRTGAGAIIEIMKNINILSETDGKLTVVENVFSNNDEKKEQRAVDNVDNNLQPANEEITDNHMHVSKSTKSGITINININCDVKDIDELTNKLSDLLKTISE